eukprot:TRINITY_DN15063_c0_g1_i1.p1 TRINITY_DN15063_c0_g1~~TRINITY_DN15063_c0_g1_i1.p1  ORF type:complete len:434 (-),score=115.48 TRINITY_DN15063_c0_g1_i1:51-1352(-)
MVDFSSFLSGLEAQLGPGEEPERPAKVGKTAGDADVAAAILSSTGMGDLEETIRSVEAELPDLSKLISASVPPAAGGSGSKKEGDNLLNDLPPELVAAMKELEDKAAKSKGNSAVGKFGQLPPQGTKPAQEPDVAAQLEKAEADNAAGGAGADGAPGEPSENDQKMAQWNQVLGMMVQVGLNDRASEYLQALSKLQEGSEEYLKRYTEVVVAMDQLLNTAYGEVVQKHLVSQITAQKTAGTGVTVPPKAAGVPAPRPDAPVNSKGYPLRPGQPDCAFYVRTTVCKFGATCRFNHPELGAQPPGPPLGATMPSPIGLQSFGAGPMTLPPGAGPMTLPPGACPMTLPPGAGPMMLPPGACPMTLPHGAGPFGLPPPGAGLLGLPTAGAGPLGLPPAGAGPLGLPPAGAAPLGLQIAGAAPLGLQSTAAPPAVPAK